MLENKVYKFIFNNNLINENETIIVGVSGGADSLSLLNILFELKNKLNIDIVVAHIEHGLRGDESIRDRDVVINFCKDRNIEYRVREIDIKKEANKRKISLELAGREIRYEFFNEIANEFENAKIATAHTANDQCETILMRIIRGTGLNGLHGIKKNINNIIRPIIFLERYEIEEYCKEKNINYCEDSTNSETIYTRNKIRHKLIPYIQEEINENIVNTVYNFANTMNEYDEFIKKYIEDISHKYIKCENDSIIILKEARDLQSIIQKELILLAYEKINLDRKDFDRISIEEVQKNLNSNKTGTKSILNNEIIVINDYGDLVFSKNIKKNKNFLKEIKLSFENSNEFDYNINGHIFKFELIENKNIDFKNNNEKFVKYFDYEKISGKIYIRNKRDGDRIIPLGMKGSKKLKSYFIDNKVSRNERENAIVLEVNNNIAWVVGFLQSDFFKVTDLTKKILKINLEV